MVRETRPDFNAPTGVQVGSNGVLFVSEAAGHRVRRIALDGTVTTLAGTGLPGGSDGSGNTATFNTPDGISMEPDGNLLVVDSVNNAVRRITLPPPEESAGGRTRGFHLGRQRFWPHSRTPTDRPRGSAARTGSPSMKRATSMWPTWATTAFGRLPLDGAVTTLAGTGMTGAYNGGLFPWEHATFNRPEALAVGSDGTVFVSDTSNNLIRKISPKGKVTTLAGDGRYWSVDGKGTKASLNNPGAMAVDPYGSLYVVEDGIGLGRIRKISPDGKLTIVHAQLGT